MQGITTEFLARSIGVKPESIRVRLCRTGSFHGLVPHKLPTGRHLRLAMAAAWLIGCQPNLAGRRRMVRAWSRHLLAHLEGLA